MCLRTGAPGDMMGHRVPEREDLGSSPASPLGISSPFSGRVTEFLSVKQTFSPISALLPWLALHR